MLLCVTVCVMVYSGEGGFQNAKFKQQSLSKICRGENTRKHGPREIDSVFEKDNMGDLTLENKREKGRGEKKTNTVRLSDGFWHKYCTASCDWRRDLCIEKRGNVESPLLDPAVCTSNCRSQEEQDVGPLFLTGDTSQSDFGWCSSSCLPPAAPPNASAMMGVVMLGAGFDGADELLYASLRDAVTVEIKETTVFTMEPWSQISHSCVAQDSFASVPANNDYAVAIRGKYMDTSTDVMLLECHSCFDINCMDLPTVLTFKGNTVPATLMSNTGVVRVGFTRGLQTFVTSAGFIASFAGTPLVSTDKVSTSNRRLSYIALTILR